MGEFFLRANADEYEKLLCEIGLASEQIFSYVNGDFGHSSHLLSQVYEGNKRLWQLLSLDRPLTLQCDIPQFSISHIKRFGNEEFTKLATTVCPFFPQCDSIISRIKGRDINKASCVESDIFASVYWHMVVDCAVRSITLCSLLFGFSLAESECLAEMNDLDVRALVNSYAWRFHLCQKKDSEITSKTLNTFVLAIEKKKGIFDEEIFFVCALLSYANSGLARNEPSVNDLSTLLIRDSISCVADLANLVAGDTSIASALLVGIPDGKRNGVLARERENYSRKHSGERFSFYGRISDDHVTTEEQEKGASLVFGYLLERGRKAGLNPILTRYWTTVICTMSFGMHLSKRKGAKPREERDCQRTHRRQSVSA